MSKIFKKLFSVGEGERLLKTYQQQMVLLLITQNIAFCSERSIKFSSPNGQFLRMHYKVLTPPEKIKSVNRSENVKNPSQKYIEMVTLDNFDFWFMGFLNYKKAINHLRQTISQLQINN